MPSDQTVTARDVLRALAEVRRRGNRAALEELEQQEPDLCEFLLEEVTALHHDVLASGASPRKVRGLSRRIETLAVVLVVSLRQAHLRLWSLDPEPADDVSQLPRDPAAPPEQSKSPSENPPD
jgi:hypothetical protein